MSNKNNNKGLASKILAAGGGVLSAVALREILLSKEEHDKKEREIKKLERQKDKYIKKIGEYEPIQIDGKGVTANDSKLMNLITRAVGTIVTNNDVFTRNKSNIRTYPFIISDNSSIGADTEVELRKYYDVLVATQVANLINHTVFSADSIVNLKDNGTRTVDRVLDKVLSGKNDLDTLGTSLQKGLYEDTIYHINEEGEISLLSESLAQSFDKFEDYINEIGRVVRNHSANNNDRNKLSREINDLVRSRENLFRLRADLNNTSINTVAGVTNPNIHDDVQFVTDLIRGVFIDSWDDVEPPVEWNVIKSKITALRDTDFINGSALKDKLNKYADELKKYNGLKERGFNLIVTKNNLEPTKDQLESDPYYRLLGLNRVDNYRDSSKLTMKMFNNSNSLKVKLEMAAALLASTEILPTEFIEYVTKYLGLPMMRETEIAIGLKYGQGTRSNPFLFMGNEYVMSSNKDVINFSKEMRPEDFINRRDVVYKLTNKQLKSGYNRFFDLFKTRNRLMRRWVAKNSGKISRSLMDMYMKSSPITDRKQLKTITRTIEEKDREMQQGAHDLGDKAYKMASGNDRLFAKSLSLMGANGTRVHNIIEDKLKNRVTDLYSIEGMDKSIEYFLDPSNNKDYDPTALFTPNIDQAYKLMTNMLQEEFDGEIVNSILTEDFILDLSESYFEESYVYNVTTPTRTVTYKEVEKDPIEYLIPAYTKGKSLLYGSAEIDQDQFRNRKVGEPIWVKVRFSDRINSVKVDMEDNDYSTVIGIKSEVFRVSEKELQNVLKTPGRAASGITGIFRQQKDQTLGLLSKIASENDLKAANLNGVLIASINEATSNIATRPSEDYINNPKLGETLRRTYNLSSICLVDSIADEYYIMEENSASWSRLPFSELRGSGSGQDVKALASIMGSIGRRG